MLYLQDLPLHLFDLGCIVLDGGTRELLRTLGLEFLQFGSNEHGGGSHQLKLTLRQMMFLRHERVDQINGNIVGLSIRLRVLLSSLRIRSSRA